MKQKKLRPHLWLVQGEVPHQQHIAYNRARAQAHFRGEYWDLTFEQFQAKWQGLWHRRGRGNGDYCLTREDPDGAWTWSNVDCIPRLEHLQRQRLYKSERRNGS